jgi:hypothetical protein
MNDLPAVTIAIDKNGAKLWKHRLLLSAEGQRHLESDARRQAAADQSEI